MSHLVMGGRSPVHRALLGQMAQQADPLKARISYRWLLGLARVLERTTRWVLQNMQPEQTSASIVDENLAGLAELREAFGDVVRGEERTLFEARVREIQELGAEEAFSRRLITLRFLDQLLEILGVARETGTGAVPTAHAYYQTSEFFEIPWLRRKAYAGAGDDQWEQRAAQVLSDDLSLAHRRISVGMMRRLGDDLEKEGAEAPDFVGALRPRETDRFRGIVDELRTEDTIGLAAVSVATRELIGVADRFGATASQEDRR